METIDFFVFQASWCDLQQSWVDTETELGSDGLFSGNTEVLLRGRSEPKSQVRATVKPCLGVQAVRNRHSDGL
jgi:hypothetical protein